MKTEDNLPQGIIEQTETQTNTQSFGNTALGFFKSSFRYAQSLVMPNRYPMARVSYRGITNAFAGVLWQSLEPDGSLKVMEKARLDALQHPSKRAFWWLGDRCCVLITTLEDLKSYQKVHDTDHVSRKVPGVGDIVPNPILFNDHPVAKTKRGAYQQAFKDTNLTQLIKILQQHLNENLTETKQAINLQNFIYESLLHLVVNAFIRENPSKQQLQQAKAFSLKATTEGFDFQSIFKWMLPPSLLGFIANHPNLFYWLLPQTLYDVFFNNESKDADINAFKTTLRKQFKEIFLDNNTNHENLVHKLSDITKANHPDQNLKAEDYAIDDGIILLLAGLETSASLMTNTVKLLCKQPDILNRLRTELQQLPSLTDQSNEKEIRAWFNAVNNIPYLQGIISEVLRLYPPTPVIIPRPLLKPIKLGENEKQVEIIDGDFVLVSPWVYGRNENIWPDPLTIKPDRWNNLTTEQRTATVVFGWGKHLCVGKAFAEETTKVFLATMFTQYDFKLEKGCDDDGVSLKQGSLKPSKPLMAFVTARDEEKNTANLQKEELTDSPHP